MSNRLKSLSFSGRAFVFFFVSLALFPILPAQMIYKEYTAKILEYTT
jgi:hypothetical protein